MTGREEMTRYNHSGSSHMNARGAKGVTTVGPAT